MKKTFIFCCLVLLANTLFSQHKPQHTKEANNTSLIAHKWSSKEPFEQKLFIENKGQYTLENRVSPEEILFGARQDGIQYFFTKNAIWMKHVKFEKRTEREIEQFKHKLGIKEEKEGEKEDKEFLWKMTEEFHQMNFPGAGSQTEIIPQNELSSLYNFGTKKRPLQAHSFKKLLYKNLYPGIDMEFYFPEDKQGFKYNFIVAPGADLSVLKIQFPGEQIKLSEEGNVVINSSMGVFTDHAPFANEANTAKAVDCSFKLENKTIGFSLSQYDATQGLIIDPWTTTPFFAGNNNAYDVDWDNAGNCYVYGGVYPYQVLKFNSAGTFLWSYTTTFAGGGYYGDFSVDRRTSSVYIVDGFNFSTGAEVYKLDASGAPVGYYGGNSLFQEMWRIAFSRCTNEAVIAGGGTTDPSYSGAYLDTNLVGITPVNVLGAPTGLHDMWGVALDDFGSAYMSTAQTLIGSPGYDNTIYKIPLPSLSPILWSAPSGYFFQEVSSVSYTGGGSGSCPNGLNGMCVSGSNLYTYDSYVLKKWNASNGALINSSNINGASSTIMTWGGLTSDGCDNIFIGNQGTISQYDGNLTNISNVAAPGMIYDVSLGKNNILYSCGNGFVMASTVSLGFCNSTVLNTGSTVTNANCSSPTGSATVTASGGTAPYTISWSDGQTGSVASNLPPGTYTVTITDNSCNPQQDQIIVTITGSPSFTLGAASSPALCSGASNGTATVSITGGTPGFNVTWSNGQTGTTATNLPQGTYTVTVVDGTGCSNNTTVVVTEPSPVTATTSFTAASCGQNNGSASVSASGGTPGYTYTWTPSGGNGATAINIGSGNYNCNITDAQGCTASIPVTVSNSSGPLVSISSASNSTCNGANNGSATVNASGGAGSYTYTWSPSGGNAATANNLPPNIYTCSVADANGCLTTTVVTISEPSAIVVTPSFTPALCGQNNGVASVNANGGTPGYNYSWAPSGGNAATASGLGAGSYTCTITDANNCTQTANITVTNSGGPTASITSTGTVTCFGASTGSATASASGGSGTYSYTWAPTGGNAATATNLPAGTYTCTVADGNNCISTTVVTIAEPASALTATPSSTSVNCNGASTGTATVVAGGGTSAYTYTWVPIGGNNSTASGLPANTYTCNITDANGCTTNTTVTIAQPAALSLAVSSTTSITCNGGSNGSAIVNASGGTAGYTYTWVPSGGSSTTASGLSAGNYTCNMTDANGCTTFTTVTITQPNAPISVSINPTPIACNGGANGAATANISGGTSAYTYTWVPSGGNAATANGLGAGSYTCNITDANGCTGTSSTIISQPAVLTLNIASTNIKCNGNANGSATANAGGGMSSYTYTWTPSGGNAATASNLGAGTYTCNITDANGCPKNATVTITQPTPIIITPTVTPVACSGGNNGAASVSIAGGITPYNVTWNTTPVQNGTSATNLAVGSYTVTVLDSNNCSVKKSVIIADVPPVDTLSITGTLCTTDPTVILSAPSGGVMPDTIGAPYQWYTGASAIGGATSGVYTGVQTNVNTYSVSWYLHGCRYITTTITETIFADISGLPKTNVFTPNADKINDEFLPLSIEGAAVPVTYPQIAAVIDAYDLYVYDRWGTLVFHTTQVLDTWTGVEVNGKDATAGTYFWIAKYKTKCNTHNSEQTIKGFVQLIR